jgi:ribokinase
MKILNFGSLNIDHVYSVEHFVRPGETLNSREYNQFAGGKGFNQSIALAHAGAGVVHAGKIGEDGAWLKAKLQKAGVEASFVETTGTPTGHAIIQVNPKGENSIVLYGGANREVTEDDVSRTLPGFGAEDVLLLQNEITCLREIITRGAEQGMRVVFNPAPMSPEVASLPLERVGLFIVNEIEGSELVGEAEPEKILEAMRKSYPAAGTILTLGDKGVLYADSRGTLRVPAESVAAVDTTAAGDTFIGFCLAEFARTGDMEAALKLGCRAAAICVTRMGASDSIPTREEL